MSAAPQKGQSRRYWVSILLASVLGLAVTTGLLLGGVIGDDVMTLLILYYLVTWVVFRPLYLVWTHRQWSRTDLGELEPMAREGRRPWWGTASGVGHPEWWSIQAGVISALIVIAASRLNLFPDQLWLPLLGLLTVAGSWALMVYAFAEKYLDLHLRGEEIDLPDQHADGVPEFGDFLSHSVTVSTMSGVHTRSRSARSAVRSHTLVAFGFNTVIVAMTVSLLFT